MFHVSKSSAENNSKIYFKKGDLALYRKSLLAGHVLLRKIELMHSCEREQTVYNFHCCTTTNLTP